MRWTYKILYAPDPNGGAGGGGSNQGGGSGGSGGSETTDKTVPEAKFQEVVTQRDELKGKVTNLQTGFDELSAKLNKIEDDKLKASGKTEELLAQKETELTAAKTKLTETETALTEIKNATDKQNKKIIKSLIDQLPDEHKELVKDSTDIDFLTGYIKINGKDKQVLDGSRGGASLNDIAAKSWNQMSIDEKQKLKDSNPALYQTKLNARNDKT